MLRDVRSARRGRRGAHRFRRPGFLERSGARSLGRALAASRVSPAELQLHRQDRASGEASAIPSRAPRARLSLRGFGRRVLERQGPSRARQGPQPGRRCSKPTARSTRRESPSGPRSFHSRRGPLAKTTRDLFHWIAEAGLVEHVDAVQLTLRLLIPPGSLLLGNESLKPVPRRARTPRSDVPVDASRSGDGPPPGPGRLPRRGRG